MSGLGPSYDFENDIQPISFSNGSQDAFSRLRVSNPETVFDASFRRDKEPNLFWESLTSGGTATHLGNNPSVQLSCTTTTGSKVIFQSKLYHHYTPGKSSLIFMTGNFIEFKTSVKKKLGYFDVNDGYFFQLSGSTLSVVLRSKVSGSVVDNVINQSNWNYDKLDGTGSSGYTLDITKQNIFFIDFQWLGSGKVRFGFCIDGHLLYCHDFFHANILTVPYCRTGRLPFRFEIENTGSSSSSMNATCIALLCEGGISWDGVSRSISSGIVPINFTTAGTLKPIISIRKNASYISDLIKLITCGVFIGTADDFIISIYKNVTLTGASWVALDGFCDKDVSSTSQTGGIELATSYVRGSATSSSDVDITSFEKSLLSFLGDSNGTSEIITISARNITATASIYAYINYLELL
jgi:hypothetical protein